jgi:hypothetical protein
MERDSYVISVQRSHDGWWAIRGENMPEGYGLYSQARRLDQVESVARDAISALLDTPSDAFTVTWIMRHPDDLNDVVSAASSARATAEIAQRASTDATKAAVDALAREGYTYRDIGTILGITHQRAQQISTAPLRGTVPERDTASARSRTPKTRDRVE